MNILVDSQAGDLDLIISSLPENQIEINNCFGEASNSAVGLVL